MPKNTVQRGSGNPGTHYSGFGQFHAEYPHVLLGGAKPDAYNGYGLTAAQYPGAGRYLTSPYFANETHMGLYPKVFSGGGKIDPEKVVSVTHRYLQQKGSTWKGLAWRLGEPGLVNYSTGKGGQIDLEESDVHYLLGRYYSQK
jgi:hypothetical protein